MAAKTEKQADPAWLIDTHGMIEALKTKNNQIRNAVIDAIEDGTMLVLRSVSEEIKSLYSDLWDDFKAIKKGSRYVPVTVEAIKAAGTLQHTYGAPIFGSIPTKEHFQAVACARLKKCTLISSEKALKHSESIAKKCGLPADTVSSLKSFADSI